MEISKVLNNNVVVVHENGHEKIVMGKGIAFQKKVHDTIDDSKIDKVFFLNSKDATSKFQQLVVDIPLEHIKLSEKIISYAKTHLGKKLNDIIYISLVDHIYTSIVRFQAGIEVKNGLLYEIKRFYPDEYYVGTKALEMIQEEFSLSLPLDEAGFIALHLANAQMDQENMNMMYEITKIMQEIINIVKYYFNIEFDEEGVHYYRFITHLKFFAQRLAAKSTYDDESDDDLLDIIKVKYKNAFECTCRIQNFIKKKYDYELSNEEKLYLTIHIERVVYKSNCE